MPHLITILAPGFEETEAVTVIDLLRRAQIQVTVLGLDSREIKGAHGITIIADDVFSSYSGPFDGIVLPGGMPGTRNLAASQQLLDLIRKTHARNGLCAAICAAPLVLAKAGILQGVRTTCFPGTEPEIAGAVVTDLPVVREGTIITSKGVGTAIPFALELISYCMGAEFAEKIGRSVLWMDKK